MRSADPQWQRARALILVLTGLVWLLGAGPGVAATVPLMIPPSDDLAPESPPPKPAARRPGRSPQRAQEYLARAKETRDADEKVALYTKAIAQDPKLIEAYLNRGMIHLRKRNLEGALNDFDKAAQIEPGNPDVYVARALVYGKKGDGAGAMREYNKALELSPNNDKIYFSIASFYYWNKHYEKAIEYLQKILAKNPNSVNALAFVAGCYTNLKQYDTALKYYDAALKLNPRGHYYLDRARVHEQLGNYSKASEDYKKATEQFNNLKK